MIRLTMCVGALCLFVAVPPVRLFAQVNPGTGRVSPDTSSLLSAINARARRARREQAVAQAGPIARDLVETQGDEAVAAIFVCSKPVAEKLAEFHASGGLGKLPRPNDLLRAIAHPGNGDDVALWAIQHANELEDTDAFDAYVHTPLEYALGLKQLAAGAAETRARRLNADAAGPQESPITPQGLPIAPQGSPIAPQVNQQELILVAGGCLILVGLFLWRRKQLQQQRL